LILIKTIVQVSIKSEKDVASAARNKEFEFVNKRMSKVKRRVCLISS
jgi:hypothetical protein